MDRSRKLLVAAVAMGLGRVSAQVAAFEVASVKPATEPVRDMMFCIGPCTFGERMTVTGTRVDIRYMSLYNLTVAAYRIKPYQLNGPEWMKSQRFDIAARMPVGASKASVPEMLQALLAERFKLSLHRESKVQQVYALVVGKNGANLRRATADADAPLPEIPGSQPLFTPQGEARQLEDGNLVLSGGAYGAVRGGHRPGGPMRWEFLSLTMSALAELLTAHEDRPVVDMTNLKGAYVLTCENHPPGSDGGRKGSGPPDAAPGANPDPFGEGLIAAVEKAGLKLEARRAPVDMLVVDRLEKNATGN